MVAAVPDRDEGEAEEEAEGAAHLNGDTGDGFGHLFLVYFENFNRLSSKYFWASFKHNLGDEGGEGVDELLLLDEGVVGGGP